MPSRAVIRKKARREAKKKKLELEGVPKKTLIVTRSQKVEPSETPKAEYKTLINAKENYVISRPKVPMPAAAEPEEAADLSGLSRKERKKMEAQRKLERQLNRLAATRVNAPVVAPESTEQDATQTPATTAAPVLRHHPRFTNGTYWKERKERRARSLFCGGVPLEYTPEQVKDLVLSVLDSSPAAQEYLAELGGVCPVESVDFLPANHSKVRNMYLLMASVPVAGCTAQLLDRYSLQGRFLRCNFAADKTQRAEAIRRRDRQ